MRKRTILLSIIYLVIFIAILAFLHGMKNDRMSKSRTDQVYAKEETIVGPEKETTATPSQTTTATPTTSPTPTPTPKKKPPKTPYLDIPLSKKLQRHIFKQCKNERELYFLAMAVIQAESDFDPDCIGIDGHDKGLMQIRDCNLESLQKKFGKVNLMDPYDNTKCGVYMLRKLYEKYVYMNLTLMAYNCGEAGARRLWRKDIYSTEYSRKVIAYYQEFCLGLWNRKEK